MTIKAIVFDMGGVLLQLVDETPRQELAKKFQIPLEKIYLQVFDSPTAKQASLGNITVQQHWQSVAAQLEIPPEETQSFFETFWSTDEIDRPLIDFVRLLRKFYKTGLLSNAWDDLPEVIENRWQVADAFDDIIVSAIVHLAKPDPRIYRLSLERLGVQPGEAVFFDDMLVNVEAACQVGMLGIQFQNRSQALKELSQTLNNDGMPPEEVDRAIKKWTS
jgi:epoxide hydrolase-like predicted phosphatase